MRGALRSRPSTDSCPRSGSGRQGCQPPVRSGCCPCGREVPGFLASSRWDPALAIPRGEEAEMRGKAMLAAAVVIVMAVVAGAGVREARAVLPPGNTAQLWDKIAEDTVVGSGAFQNEGLIYMSYVSNAMYRAVAPGERRGQSADAALVEAAYTTLSHYFPAQAAALDALHQEALAAIPDDQKKVVGIRFGALAAAKEIAERDGDGLQTPIASTAASPTLDPGAGVWRLTRRLYRAP